MSGARTPGLIAEVTRMADDREVIESTHVGHLVVVGPDGAVEQHVGDPDLTLFVRSTAKPFQAAGCLELLEEHGPVSPDELGDDEVAVAWASHAGEQRHLEAVRRLLARSGTTPDGLTCPPAFPEADQRWPPASPGEPPSRLRFNCSGKHALFALAGRGLGIAGPALLDGDAALQQHLIAATAAAIGPLAGLGIDGCGAPAVVAPLRGLAAGYRDMALGGRWERARRAGLAHPGLVGGEGRVESALLAAGVVAKWGAEGVFAAGWVGDDGAARGLAVKGMDGSVRAGATAMVAVLAARGVVPPDVWEPPVVLGGSEVVGVVRAAPALREV